MNTIVRRAVANDLEGIQEVLYRTWLVTYPNAHPGISVDDIEDRFHDRHDPEHIAQRRAQLAFPPHGQSLLVAVQGTSIIGVCRATRHLHNNQLRALYVLPEFQQQGVGSTLWGSVRLQLSTAHPTIVEVASYNTRAIRFYSSLGFHDTGMRKVDTRFRMRSGSVIPEIVMRREADVGNENS